MADSDKEWFSGMRFKLDPQQLERSLLELQDRLRQTVDQGRYTRVRILYKGKQLIPDVPMAAFLAGEVATFWFMGPLHAIAVNLGIKSFIEVELIHEASELIQKGRERFADGEVEEAEALYREALACKPGDHEALYNLGVLMRVSGRREEAERCLEQVASGSGELAEKAKELLEKMRS